jgi:sodium transport system ATP-binding protein
VIEVHDLRKTYKDRKRGRIEALRGVSFTCVPGEVFGLLGPNGAGKTTALRIISTALRPTAGGGSVMGFDLETQSAEVRRHIGVLPAGTGLYGRLTPREILTYFGKLFSMSVGRIEQRVAELAEAFQMSDFLDRACDKLSSGQRQKVNIARTVLHSPPVMIFDEPTTGLDVLTNRTIIQLIRRCRQEQRTVLFSTHVMAEVEKLCDKVAVIHEGNMLFCDTVQEMGKRYGEDLDEAFIQMVEEGR